MTAALAPLIALALDAAFGEPPAAIHPVVWMGAAIARGRAWALGASPRGQFARGSFVALAIPVASATIALGLRAVAVCSPPLAAVALTAVALKPMFAVRALRDAAFRVRNALECGDLGGARAALSSLCSRNAEKLDETALVAAAIESVAENACDSIVAPLFYFACFGLPGAAFYRAANTLDAMMGYHGELEWAGKAGARLDDLLNLVPARITGLLLIAAGAVSGAHPLRGIAILRRDGSRTESPNAGKPMAAMAGLLGVRLFKEGHYELGGDGGRAVRADITRAWRIVWIASLAVAMATSAVEWWRAGSTLTPASG
jgi:adenosylcobinamide-phosphate synthase